MSTPKYYWADALAARPTTPVLPMYPGSNWVFLGEFTLTPDRAADVGLTFGSSYQVSLAANAYNLYGLHINSALFIHSGGVKSIVSAGGTISVTNVAAVFYQTDTPTLQPDSYFFTKPDVYPMPWNYEFQVTNTTPMLFAPVGKRYGFSGYAKQTIANGYNDTYAYLGQYFDKALKVTNGVITTTQTGILSENGVLVATEPGPVALITKPDIETGARGTCIVHCVSMQLDANHDGVMDQTFGGPDITSGYSPFRFWINNDRDEPASGSKPDRDLQNTTPSDSFFGNLRCPRNLEDFARLWIVGLPDLPPAQGYSVTLSIESYSGTTIGLYAAQDPQGGVGYLTNTIAATNQFTKQFLGNQLVFDYAKRLALIEPGTSYQLPLTSTGQLMYNGHYLFEGVNAGSGTLILTVWQNGAAVCNQTAYLELKDVRDMYEWVHVENVTETTPNNLLSTYKEDNNVVSEIGEEKNIAVFVHGWRMDESDSRSFAESMFKRFYWQGFKGRFVALRWPTRSKETDGPVGQYTTYNRSEFLAFQSGRAAADYLAHLRQRFPDYSIGVAAHSMGGIVMMEALKRDLALSRQSIDRLVIMQAAVPAHCYGTSLPNYGPLLNAEISSHTPDTYRGYPGGINNAVGTSIVNFFNTNDFALATGTFSGVPVNWEENQKSFKPYAPLNYSSNGTNAHKNFFTLVTDPREIMSFVARPRSKAVGAQPGVAGVITTVGEIDLRANYGFNDKKDEHSAQFNWNIQRLRGFSFELLDKMGISASQ